MVQKNDKPADAATLTQLGSGVFCTVNGDDLMIKVSLKGDLGVSNSGKSKIVATTGGCPIIPNHPDIKLNLTCFRMLAGSKG